MVSSVRCLVVWGTTTALAGMLLGWLLPGLARVTAAATGDFAALLGTGSALVGAGCVGWLWFLVTLGVAEAHRGRPTRTVVPPVVRRLVLAACGASLAGGLALPAQADHAAAPPPESGQHATRARLVGLPVPDLTTSTTAWLGAVAEPEHRTGTRPTEPEPRTVRVGAGDTLWALAEASLPTGAGAAAIDRRWREIYRANAGTLGADPDLIHPGQRIVLPPAGHSHR